MQDIYDDAILNTTKAWWDEQYKSYSKDKIAHDDWLKMFEDIIKTCDTPIIDLGCGTGNDIKCLMEYGKEVIPCDYSEDAIKSIQINFPDIERTECFDIKERFPFEDDFTSWISQVVVLRHFDKVKSQERRRKCKREGKVRKLKDQRSFFVDAAARCQ